MRSLSSCVLAAALFFPSSLWSSQVTSATLKADRGEINAPCPASIHFTGSIATDAAGVVSYRFIRSDGASGPVMTLNFSAPGTQPVSTDWQLGQGTQSYKVWIAIRVITPNALDSQPAAVSITCNPGGAVPLKTQAAPQNPGVTVAVPPAKPVVGPAQPVPPKQTIQRSVGVSVPPLNAAARIENAIENWDFENGLTGWTASGNAFIDPRGPRQPVFGDNVNADRIRPVALGGDYWNVPYPIGQHGQYWIGTYEYRPSPDAPRAMQGDGPTGTLLSKAFVIDPAKRFIDFLVSGGKDVARLRVELLVKMAPGEDPGLLPKVAAPDGDYRVAMFATGMNSEIFRREVWDVSALPGKTARIRILDDSDRGWGHINVDDFRFESVDPRPRLITVNNAGTITHRDPDFPAWGFADTHAHPMANYGFGGKAFYGGNDGPMEVALAACDTIHGAGGSGICPGGHCVGNALFAAVEGGVGHLTGGWPWFDGWPAFDTKTHQTMYVDWIKRAYDGGQRLMVALAVNNMLLAHEFGGDGVGGVRYDDEYQAELQVQKMKDFASRHSDFMEIAYTPADARRIIAQNKMAIVLGVEVDALNNWRTAVGNPSDPRVVPSADAVRTYVDRLYAMGVRHLFPVHLANGPFGGMALYKDEWNANNLYLRGDYVQVADGGPNIGFRMAEHEGAVIKWYRLNPLHVLADIALGGVPDPAATAAVAVDVGTLGPANSGGGWYNPPRYEAMFGTNGHVNVQGLTRDRGIGDALIDQMMHRGMIIDVDHMSRRMFNDVLSIAESRTNPQGERGYPVIAGHTGFNQLHLTRNETSAQEKMSHEGDKDPEQIERIRNVGGMVAMILHTTQVYGYSGSTVPNDCPGTSKAWAQVYQYGLEHMGGKNIAFSTDFPLNGTLGPRFGGKAAIGWEGDDGREQSRRADVKVQRNGVRYDSPVTDWRPYRWRGGAYESRQEGIWNGVALGMTDVDIDATDLGFRLVFGVNPYWIRDIGKGIRKARAGERVEAIPSDLTTINVAGTPLGMLSYNWGVVQRAGWYAYHFFNPPLVTPQDIPQGDIRELAGEVGDIVERWTAMQGPASQPPLRRYVIDTHTTVAGQPNFRRDYDINLDGIAHYGMLPDFLQDLKNDGLTPEQMAPLFNSAEAYIQMWEKCERMR